MILQLVTPELRSDRMVILEFMLLHPDQALAVHLFFILNPKAFRTLVSHMCLHGQNHPGHPQHSEVPQYPVFDPGPRPVQHGQVLGEEVRQGL